MVLRFRFSSGFTKLTSRPRKNEIRKIDTHTHNLLLCVWKAAYYYVFINHRDARMDEPGSYTHYTQCAEKRGGMGSATGCAHQRWRRLLGGKWVVSRGSQHNQGDSPRLPSSSFLVANKFLVLRMKKRN